MLTSWLAGRGVDAALIPRVLRQLERAASLGEGRQLYDANKEVYRLLRYGVKEKSGAGEQHQTVWLVDWANPEANDFAIAEEVTVAGENTKRPDLALYVNGIALGVIELKRSTVSIGEGIRQNLDNQQQDFIRNFSPLNSCSWQATTARACGTVPSKPLRNIIWSGKRPALCRMEIRWIATWPSFARRGAFLS